MESPVPENVAEGESPFQLWLPWLLLKSTIVCSFKIFSPSFPSEPSQASSFPSPYPEQLLLLTSSALSSPLFFFEAYLNKGLSGSLWKEERETELSWQWVFPSDKLKFKQVELFSFSKALAFLMCSPAIRTFPLALNHCHFLCASSWEQSTQGGWFSFWINILAVVKRCPVSINVWYNHA